MAVDIHQGAACSEVKDGTGNVSVQATAGSGKTYTLLEMLKLVPRFKKTVFLSFSNAIVKELKSRVPTHIRASTLHSLGNGMITARYKHLKGILADENKYFKLALAMYPHKSKQVYKSCYEIQEICNYARLTLTPFDTESLADLCNKYVVNYDQEMLLIAEIILMENTQDTYLKSIDFTDMIYYPAVYPHSFVNEYYDYIFLDEAQDNNNCQTELIAAIMKKGTGRLIFVGDHRQCQPTGTKVLLSTGEHKPIEDVVVNDNVVGYDCPAGRGFVGTNTRYKSTRKDMPFVEEVAKRWYSGDLISVYADGNRSSYTPEHICMARFNPDANYRKAQVLYIMEKGGNFRIGITPLWGCNDASFTYRAKGERADKMWILNIYDKKRNAFIDEQFYSYEFGIPQLRFFDNATGLFHQDELDDLWSRYNKEDQKNRAVKILESFGRMYDHPMFEKGKTNYYSKLHIRPVRACNLFSGYMQVAVYDKTFIKNERAGRGKAKYCDFKLTTKKYDGYVYSLNVSKFQNYVADNILTHNCIFGFMGSGIDSFEQLIKRFKTKEMRLTVSYRCSKAVVALAQTIYPDDIEAHPDASEGVVRRGDLREADQGDMVICRNTRPLIEAFFDFIHHNKKSYIVGKDLEKGLIALAESVMDYSTTAISNNLEIRLQELEEELRGEGVSKPTQHDKYIALLEKCDIVGLILSKVDRPDELVPKIQQIFHPDKQAIKLLTAHRSKGLECERVFFIETFNGDKLCPSKYAVLGWQLIQEKNLLFVTYTRAKNEFVFVDYIKRG